MPDTVRLRGMTQDLTFDGNGCKMVFSVVQKTIGLWSVCQGYFDKSRIEDSTNLPRYPVQLRNGRWDDYVDCSGKLPDSAGSDSYAGDRKQGRKTIKTYIAKPDLTAM